MTNEIKLTYNDYVALLAGEEVQKNGVTVSDTEDGRTQTEIDELGLAVASHRSIPDI